MFSPNPKRPRSARDLERSNRPDNKPMTRIVKQRLWTTVALTFILLVIWYGSLAMAEAQHNETLFQGVMIVYFVAFAAVLITYLAYNRAFVNKDVTVDMLPADWSEEKKQAFVEGNRRRAEHSRWMVTIIIAFAVVFMVEALYLFVLDGFLADFLQG